MRHGKTRLTTQTKGGPDLLGACKMVANNLDRKSGYDYLIHQVIMDKVLQAIANVEGRE